MKSAIYDCLLLVPVCVCSKEKQSGTAKSPRLHAAADHPASHLISHGPRNNYTDRHLPPRNDTVVPSHPYSQDFRTQRAFHSAATCIPHYSPWGGDEGHMINGWHHSSPMVPGSDQWRCFQPSYPVNQFMSPDVPFHHTASFSQPQKHHRQLDGWMDGQLYSGQMNGHGYSRQPRHQENDWKPVGRRQHQYQHSRHHHSHQSSRTHAGGRTNRNNY